MAGYPITNTQKLGIIDGVERFRCQTRYMGVFDVDEFFFPTNPDASLLTLLKTYLGSGQCGGVGAWRLNFGSNNHTDRPEGLVIENYTRRDANVITGKKLLFNPRRMAGLRNTHNFYFDDGLPLCDEKFRPQTFTILYDVDEGAVREVDVLRINHYYTKSFADWAARLERGAISGSSAIFDWSVFRASDKNDVLDPAIQRYLPALRAAMAKPFGL